MMKEAIKKSEVLIEALPYIKKFFEKIVVIKYGGAAVDEKALIGYPGRHHVYELRRNAAGHRPRRRAIHIQDDEEGRDGTEVYKWQAVYRREIN